MTDSPPDDPEAEIQRLVKTYGKSTVRRWLAQKPPPTGKQRRGRSSISDEMALARMADLLHRGEAESEREAARLAAQLAEEGASTQAKIDRLRRKFRERREPLLQEAAERHRLTAPAAPARALTPNEAAALLARYTDPLEQAAKAIRAQLGELLDVRKLDQELRRQWEPVLKTLQEVDQLARVQRKRDAEVLQWLAEQQEIWKKILGRRD